MAIADIVSRVRSILYGSVIGEAPSIRIAASNASESVTGPKLTFNLDTSEGDYVQPGQVLSVRGANDSSTAFVLYVLSKSSDAITALNGYEGPSVTGSDSGDLDNLVFEQNPPVTEYSILKHIEQVFDSLLYPHIVKRSTATVAANVSDYQHEVPATVEKIVSAWQVISGEAVQIPFDLMRDVHTTVSSTGMLAYFGAFDGTTIYYTYEEKYDSADTLGEDLEYCVAIGAAALAAGSQVHESNMASASKDSQARGGRDVSASLWRDFITLRTSISEEQAEDYEYFEIVR